MNTLYTRAPSVSRRAAWLLLGVMLGVSVIAEFFHKPTSPKAMAGVGERREPGEGPVPSPGTETQAPSHPTDPSAPSDPTDPTDPSHPTDLSDQTAPTDPSQTPDPRPQLPGVPNH